MSSRLRVFRRLARRVTDEPHPRPLARRSKEPVIDRAKAPENLDAALLFGKLEANLHRMRRFLG